LNKKQHKKIDIVGIVTIGFFLILLGIFQFMILVHTPDFSDSISSFSKDFYLQQISPNIYLPTPQSDHPLAYNLIFQFCLIFGIFEVFALVARFILKDPMEKKAGTASGIIFWLGAALLVNMLLKHGIEWIAFIGWLITLLGISVIVNIVIVLITRAYSKN